MTRSLNLPKVLFFSVKSQKLWHGQARRRPYRSAGEGKPLSCSVLLMVLAALNTWRGFGEITAMTKGLENISLTIQTFSLISEGCQCCCQNPPYIGVGALWLEFWLESLLQGGFWGAEPTPDGSR